MGYERQIVILVLCGLGLLAAGGPLAAASPGPVSVSGAHKLVTAAHRATLRAQAAEREARHVERATRAYCAEYGHPVGRWVFAARRAGWPWGQLDTLCAVMYRESRGSERAKNPLSTASGLAQFLAFWWDGSDKDVRNLFQGQHLAYPWNPYDAWQTLLHWWAVVRSVGWSPWAQ